MGDKRPDWRRRQSEMGIRFNPVRGGGGIPLPGEIISRRQRNPKQKIDREAAGGGKFHMKPDEVYDLDPEDRFNWLQSALLLAGRGNIKADAVYDIIASSKFASGVISGDFGNQMKASLLANLHLFKKEQQKAIKSDIGKLLAATDAYGDGKGGGALSSTEANGRQAAATKQPEDDNSSTERSGNRSGSRKDHSSDRSSSHSRRRRQSRSCSRSASHKKSSRQRSRKASHKKSSERSRKKIRKDDQKGQKRKRSSSCSTPAERSISLPERSSLAQEMVKIAQEEEEEAKRLRELEQQALERKEKEEKLRRTLMELAAGEEEEAAEKSAKAKKKKEKKSEKNKKINK